MKRSESLKALFLLVATALFFFSCSHSDIRILSKAKDNDAASIRAVVISKEKIFIVNADDVNDDIALGNEKDVYKRFFADNFLKQLKKNGMFGEVTYLPNSPSFALRDTTIKVNSKRKLTVSLPKNGTSLKTDSIDAEVLLFIERNATFRQDKEVYNWTRMPDGTISPPILPSRPDRLFQEITFILWDNVLGKPISIGRAVAKTSEKEDLSKLSWDNGIEELAKQVLKNTGYAKNN